MWRWIGFVWGDWCTMTDRVNEPRLAGTQADEGRQWCEMSARAGQQPSWGPKLWGAPELKHLPQPLHARPQRTVTNTALPWKPPEARRSNQTVKHTETKQTKHTAETKMQQTKPSWTALFRRQLQHLTRLDSGFSYSSWEFINSQKQIKI